MHEVTSWFLFWIKFHSIFSSKFHTGTYFQVDHFSSLQFFHYSVNFDEFLRVVREISPVYAGSTKSFCLNSCSIDRKTQYYISGQISSPYAPKVKIFMKQIKWYILWSILNKALKDEWWAHWSDEDGISIYLLWNEINYLSLYIYFFI